MPEAVILQQISSFERLFPASTQEAEHIILQAPAYKTYKTLKEWYEQEFGLLFTNGALNEARNKLLHAMRILPRQIKKDGYAQLLVQFYEQVADEITEHRWRIKDKIVSREEYILYCKGMYYMAAFLILRDQLKIKKL